MIHKAACVPATASVLTFFIFLLDRQKLRLYTQFMTTPASSPNSPDRELLRQQEIAHQMKMIRSNLASTRSSAARRLGELKAGASALLYALQDSYDNVRLAAAGALGSFSNDEQVGEIVEALLAAIDDPSERVGQAAIRSLGLLRADSARVEIEELLEDENPYIVGAAVLALGRMGAEDLAPRLAEFLDHESMYLQTQAVRAVGMLGYAPAGPRLVMLLANSRALRQASGQVDPQAYLEHREDDLYTMQNHLVRAITALRVPEAAPLLVEIAQKDVGLRGLAVEALIVIRAELDPEAMSGLFADPSSGLRRRLITLMVQQNYRQALPFLRKLLADTSVASRSAAMQALTQMRDLESLPQLEWIAYHDPNPFARVQGVHSVAGLLGSEAAEKLLPLTNDANFEVRRAAVLYLYEHLSAEPGAMATLARFARDFPADILATSISARLAELDYTLPPEAEHPQLIVGPLVPQTVRARAEQLTGLLEVWRQELGGSETTDPDRYKTRLALEHLIALLKNQDPQ